MGMRASLRGVIQPGALIKPVWAKGGVGLQLSAVARSMGCMAAVLPNGNQKSPLIIGVDGPTVAPWSINGTPTSPSTEEGPSINLSTTSTNMNAAVPMGGKPASVGFSIVARLKGTASSTSVTGSSGAYIRVPGQPGRFGVSVWGSTGVANATVTGNTATGAVQGATDYRGTYVTLGVSPSAPASTSADFAQLYENGALVGTSGTNSGSIPNSSSNVGATIAFGEDIGVGDTTAFVGDIAWAFFFVGTLTAAQHWFVAKNTWALLEPAHSNLVGVAPSGASSFNATLNVTLGALTLAGTGQIPVNASLASTLAALTLAGTGQVPVNASLAATLAAVTLAGTGQVPVNAQLSTTLGALSLAGTGTIPVNAQLASTLGNLTLLGTATVPVNATLSITLDPVTLAGIEVGPSFNATLNTTLSALTLAGTGQVTVNAALSQALAAATLSGTATVTGQGSTIAGTPIDYWSIKVAIKSALDAQLAATLPKPVVVVEQQFPIPPNESWIGIYQDSRTAPDSFQNLANGTKTRIMVRHTIWVWRYAMDQDKAIQLRNSLLGDVELALMLDRTFGGIVETSWLEGGRLVTADDPSKSGKFFAGAEIVLTADTYARTT